MSSSSQRVLLTPVGSHGDIHPFIGLALGLRARGHDVHFITLPHYRSLIESLGFPLATVGTDEDFESLTMHPDVWHPTRSVNVIFGQHGIARRHLREGYARVEERCVHGKTLVVGSLLAMWARTAAERLNVPMVTVHLQPSVLWSTADPPELPAMRMRDWWPHWFRDALYGAADRYLFDRLIGPELNRFRAEVGLPPARRIVGRWANSPDRILGFFPEWYAAAPDWPSQFRHVGFVRYDQGDSFPLTAQLEQFITQGEPPIVFTFGSAQRQGRPYFTAAAEACCLLGRRGLLIARGGDQIPHRLPAGVLHVEYAPFSQVFPRAAAVVHHGGIGTCAQALSAGVPQLVMPLAFDQPDNARRLERLGVGARLWPKAFTPPRVAEALRALMASSVTAKRATAMAERMRSDDPVQAACTLIEEMLC